MPAKLSNAGLNLGSVLTRVTVHPACLHFVNATPIDWCSKKQSTLETATQSLEFVAARTCAEQVMDLRIALWCLGV